MIYILYRVNLLKLQTAGARCGSGPRVLEIVVAGTGRVFRLKGMADSGWQSGDYGFWWGWGIYASV